MKKFIRRIFAELYHWQNDNWGADNLPILTSLLLLSSLQVLNLVTLSLIFYLITESNISAFLVDNKIATLSVGLLLLILNYFMIRPISVTVNENPSGKKKIVWIYVLSTIFLLAITVGLVIYNNEKG